MDFDGTGKPTINAPTAPGPFAVSPVVRIFTIDPAEPDQLGAQPARHRPQRRRHARLRRLPDDPRRHRRGSGRQHRPAARPLLRACRPIRLEQSILRGKIDFFTSRPFWSDRGWGGCCVVPPRRPHRQRDVVVRGRPAPDDRRSTARSATSKAWPISACSTGARCATRTRISSSTRAASSAAAASSSPPPTSTWTGSRPIPTPTSATTVPPAPTARCSRTTSPTGSRSRSAAPSRRPARSGNPSRGRDIFGAAAPGGANCVACHSGAKWTTSRVTYDPVDVNPVPGTDTGIVNIADPARRVPERLQLRGRRRARLRGAARRRGAAERLRITRQVGTFTATNPIEVRHPTRSARSTPWRRR